MHRQSKPIRLVGTVDSDAASELLGYCRALVEQSRRW